MVVSSPTLIYLDSNLYQYGFTHITFYIHLSLNTLLLILSVKPFPVWPLVFSRAISNGLSQQTAFLKWKVEFDSERVFTYRLSPVINSALLALELPFTVACRAVHLRVSTPGDKPSNPQLLPDVPG